MQEQVYEQVVCTIHFTGYSGVFMSKQDTNKCELLYAFQNTDIKSFSVSLHV